MNVTDTLARIDYALMIETNAAGAEWLLDEFDRKWKDNISKRRRRHPGVYVRPIIEVLDDHNCLCDPEYSEWDWSSDAYHSCGDVICSQCERTVHELDASWMSNSYSDYHAGHWFCLDCYPLSPPLLTEEVS